MNDISTAKANTIDDLIEAEKAGRDINSMKYKKMLDYLRYFDIALYAKLRKLKYDLNDIDKRPKVDLIKSIVKHNYSGE